MIEAPSATPFKLIVLSVSPAAKLTVPGAATVTYCVLSLVIVTTTGLPGAGRILTSSGAVLPTAMRLPGTLRRIGGWGGIPPAPAAPVTPMLGAPTRLAENGVPPATPPPLRPGAGVPVGA